jgi:hypothetical protein
LIALVGPALGALLRKEKDEASPSPTVFGAGSSNFLHSSFAKSGGFLFSGFALVSQPKPFRGFLFAEPEIERSAQ